MVPYRIRPLYGNSMVGMVVVITCPSFSTRGPPRGSRPAMVMVDGFAFCG